MSFLGYGVVPLGYGGLLLLLEPSLQKLPRSATSLTIVTAVVTPEQVRDIMAQLPNLDDLELSVFFAVTDQGELLRTGSVLNRRFGGRLILRSACVGEGTIEILLGIPSGL